MSKPANLSKSLSTTYEALGQAKSLNLNDKIEEFSQTYDYCMVFPMKKVGNEYQQTGAAQYVVEELLSAGFEIYPFLSVQGDELLVLIRCPVRSSKDILNFQCLFAYLLFKLFAN